MKAFISNFQLFDQIFEQLKADHLSGGLADGKSLQDIADHHNVNLLELEDQYEIGMTVEREHTASDDHAAEITMDHLWEMPDYYTRLKKMEDH